MSSARDKLLAANKANEKARVEEYKSSETIIDEFTGGVGDAPPEINASQIASQNALHGVTQSTAQQKGAYANVPQDNEICIASQNAMHNVLQPSPQILPFAETDPRAFTPKVHAPTKCRAASLRFYQENYDNLERIARQYNISINEAVNQILKLYFSHR